MGVVESLNCRSQANWKQPSGPHCLPVRVSPRGWREWPKCFKLIAFMHFVLNKFVQAFSWRHASLMKNEYTEVDDSSRAAIGRVNLINTFTDDKDHYHYTSTPFWQRRRCLQGRLPNTEERTGIEMKKSHGEEQVLLSSWYKFVSDALWF